MEAEQRIQALEQEVQILKTQIQSILLDIQTHLLTNAYPALRGHHTASSSAEDEEDDDEYDRAAPAPKVRKVTANGVPAKQPKVVAPPVPAQPMLASLDEQQEWVLENIQRLGLSRTRDLIQGYTENRQFSPEVSDTLLRFTNMYAAAAEEPTLPSRPTGMPTAPVTVRPVTTAPKQPVKARAPQPPPPVPEPEQRRAKPVQKAQVIKPQPAAPIAQPTAIQQQPAHTVQPPVEAEGSLDAGEPSSLVLRLIAGVQNAGAGVRWGKTKS